MSFSNKRRHIVQHVEDKLADVADEMMGKITFMKTLLAILWMPGGIGILGLMLLLDKDEEWRFRLIGLLIAVVMSPFMLLTLVGMLGNEAFTRIKSLRK